MPEKLTISTIPDYFNKNFNELSKVIESKLFSYTGREYPLAICLSSDFEDGTLLGTVNFLELDINGYPIYIGNVVKSTPGFINIIYSTQLSSSDKDPRLWRIRLSFGEQEDIIIQSVPTTSLNPTSVEYDRISRPTPGACVIG
jgi:hypothetical protein